MMWQRSPVRSFNWVEWIRQGEGIWVLLQRRGAELSNTHGGEGR
jgi:hypothetical protein